MRDIYLLKKLDDLNNWSWKLIHSTISHYLHKFKKDNTFTVDKYKEQFAENIKNKINTLYYESLWRDYSHWYKPEDKNKVWLVEHYYKEIQNDQHETIIENVINKIINCIDNIKQTQIYENIQRWISNKKLYIEPSKTNFDEMKFESANLPSIILYVQPDFRMKDENNKYIIIDRKTWNKNTEEDEIVDQLLAQAYRIYVQEKPGDDAIIEGYLCYLDIPHELLWGRISINEIIEYEHKIKDDIETLKDLLINRDPERNEPIGIENFYKTNNINKCKNCAFRIICDRNA